MTAAGLPHSGTPGSPPACGSPGTIAACRALLRLSVPRHPPCALSSLGRNHLRPHSKARLSSEEDRRTRQTHHWFCPFLLPFPYPNFQKTVASKKNRWRARQCIILARDRQRPEDRPASFLRHQPREGRLVYTSPPDPSSPCGNRIWP